MDGRRYREERPDGARFQNWSLGVLLRWDAHLLESVSSEERMSSFVLLARPVQCCLKHPQVALNRVGSDTTARHSPAAPPHDVVVNTIRRELAHELGTPEELHEIATRLPE